MYAHLNLARKVFFHFPLARERNVQLQNVFPIVGRCAQLRPSPKSFLDFLGSNTHDTFTNPQTLCFRMSVPSGDSLYHQSTVIICYVFVRIKPPNLRSKLCIRYVSEYGTTFKIIPVKIYSLNWVQIPGH